MAFRQVFIKTGHGLKTMKTLTWRSKRIKALNTKDLPFRPRSAALGGHRLREGCESSWPRTCRL